MNMERLHSTSSDSGFWTTIDLLVGREWRDKNNDACDENELKKHIQKNLAAAKVGKLKRNGKKNWSLCLDKSPEETLLSDGSLDLRLAGSARELQQPLTDRDHMQRLRDHVQLLAEEALQKRIAARESDEMERLKKLLLTGKTPMKDCPPELREHPVFVFWRVVDKEVQKYRKSKSDHKKTRKSRRKGTQSEPGTSIDSEESNLCRNNDEIFEYQDQANGEKSENTLDSSETKRFTPQATKAYKYEDESVEELRELMTVEELYQMADRIIGIYRDADSER